MGPRSLFGKGLCMKIVVCFKVVHDEQEVKVEADRTLSFDKAPVQPSAYDLNALEAAVSLVEKEGGEVVLLTAGPSSLVENSKMRKGILARGAGSMIAVSDDALAGADSLYTAKVLAAAVEKIGDVCWTREIRGLKGASFAEQDAVLDELIARYRPLRVCMDRTGIGEKPVE